MTRVRVTLTSPQFGRFTTYVYVEEPTEDSIRNEAVRCATERLMFNPLEVQTELVDFDVVEENA